MNLITFVVVTLTLPWMGNLAVIKACVASLNGLKGLTILNKEAKTPTVQHASFESLRITSPLKFLDKTKVDATLKAPTILLTLLGCTLKEVKTSGWSTYILHLPLQFLTFCVCQERVPFLSLVWPRTSPLCRLPSGLLLRTKSRRLHTCSAPRPWEQAPLCFRRGGAKLGIQKEETVKTSHSWVLFRVKAFCWIWAGRLTPDLVNL